MSDLKSKQAKLESASEELAMSLRERGTLNSRISRIRKRIKNAENDIHEHHQLKMFSETGDA